MAKLDDLIQQKQQRDEDWKAKKTAEREELGQLSDDAVMHVTSAVSYTHLEPEWVHLATNEDGIQMNSYFIDHPDMVLGEMKMVSGPFGPTPTCEPYPEHPLEALLAEAVQNIHGEIAAYDREEELEGEDHSIEADPAVRNFSYTLVDGQIYYRENSRMNPVEVSKTAESRIRGMIELRDCVRTLLEYQTEDYPDEEIKAQQAKLRCV